MSKHTPGPWVTRGATIRSTHPDAPADPVCRCAGLDSTVDANARLIAAAPDLLEALANMVGAFGGVGETTSPAIESARAAIRKATAEGETT